MSVATPARPFSTDHKALYLRCYMQSPENAWTWPKGGQTHPDENEDNPRSSTNYRKAIARYLRQNPSAKCESQDPSDFMRTLDHYQQLLSYFHHVVSLPDTRGQRIFVPCSSSPGTGTEEEQVPPLREEDDVPAYFEKLLSRSKRSAIAMLADDVERGLASRTRTLDYLYSQLVASRTHEKSPYYEAVMRIYSPTEIYSVASEQYRRNGLDRRLSLAASLLIDKGQESWPVLRYIAASRTAECEYFVDAAVFLSGISREERSKVFIDLARNPCIDVRLALLNSLSSLIADKLLTAVVQELASDENEDVREEAIRLTSRG